MAVADYVSDALKTQLKQLQSTLVGLRGHDSARTAKCLVEADRALVMVAGLKEARPEDAKWQTYLEIVRTALDTIKEAARAGDFELCVREANHVHNVPWVLEAGTPESEGFYWKAERAAHLGAYGEAALRRYGRLWDKLEKLGATGPVDIEHGRSFAGRRRWYLAIWVLSLVVIIGLLIWHLWNNAHGGR